MGREMLAILLLGLVAVGLVAGAPQLDPVVNFCRRNDHRCKCSWLEIAGLGVVVGHLSMRANVNTIDNACPISFTFTTSIIMRTSTDFGSGRRGWDTLHRWRECNLHQRHLRWQAVWKYHGRRK